MTPAAVEDEVRRAARALPRPRGAGRRDQRQPARRARASARRPPPSGSTSTATSTASSPTPTRSRARRARALREHLDERAAQPPAQRAGRATSTCRCGPTTSRAQPGTARRCTGLRRPGVPGAARPAVRDPRGAEPEVEAPASRSTGAPLGAGEVAGWLDDARRRRRARSACTSSGTWRARHRRRRRPSPLADGGRRRGLARRRPTLDARGRRGARGLARRPAAAQGAARRQGAAAGAAPRAAGTLAGLASDTALAAYLVRPDQRSYDLADLDAALPAGASCAPRTPPAARACSTSTRRRRRRGARPRCCGPGRCSTWPRRSTTQLEATGRRRAARRGRAAAGRTCWRAWSAPASPSTSTSSTELEADFAAEVRKAARGRLRRDRQARSTSARPSSCRWCCSTSSACPRPSAPRPATPPTPTRCSRPLRQDRAPVPRAPAAPPRRDPAAVDRRGAAQVGRRRRPHPHDVQPDHRGDRAAVQSPTPTCRTSRSAPRRAAGSARRSSSARATSR